MDIVSLVSGGLDSTLMAVLIHEEKMKQYPLFIDYGQLNKEKELSACEASFKRHHLPNPQVMSLSGYGAVLSSGLTDPAKRILEDAFLPCRNLFFLVTGAAYAYQCGANAVAIGLLDDAFSIFPDQTMTFIKDAEALVSKSLGISIRILTPLKTFSKADVVRAAKEKGIHNTYSCHAGTEKPCGVCIACREYIDLEV